MPVGDERRVVVWRAGEALLAAPLDATAEVVPVGEDGKAATRAGRLELRAPPGLAVPPAPRRAVLLRVDEAVIAMAADDVEGVQSYTEDHAVAVPPWLQGLSTGHLAGLIRLDGDRVAALLALDSLLEA